MNLWEECLKIVVIVIEIIWLLVRIGKSNWTQDEVDKLMAIVDEQLAVVSTVNWTLVAEKMGTRSRIQCRYKWNRMKGINQDK